MENGRVRITLYEKIKLNSFTASSEIDRNMLCYVFEGWMVFERKFRLAELQFVILCELAALCYWEKNLRCLVLGTLRGTSSTMTTSTFDIRTNFEYFSSSKSSSTATQHKVLNVLYPLSGLAHKSHLIPSPTSNDYSFRLHTLQRNSTNLVWWRGKKGPELAHTKSKKTRIKPSSEQQKKWKNLN